MGSALVVPSINMLYLALTLRIHGTLLVGRVYGVYYMYHVLCGCVVLINH